MNNKKKRSVPKKQTHNIELLQEKKKNGFLTPQTLGAIFAALMAFGSTWYAKNTYNLAFEQLNDERTAVWLSKVNQKKEEITFTTNNENIAMQRAYVFFPEPFSDSTREIIFPEFKLPTTVLKMDLEEYLDSKYTREEGKSKVVEGNIPFVLNSYYVAKGTSYSVQSIYHLRYLVTMGKQEGSFPTIEIQGFWFDHHLGLNEDPIEALKTVWEEGDYRKDYTGL